MPTYTPAGQAGVGDWIVGPTGEPLEVVAVLPASAVRSGYRGRSTIAAAMGLGRTGGREKRNFARWRRRSRIVAPRGPITS